jgi:hypothetical protein
MPGLHFVTVLVEEHEAIPDGCVQRFRATGEPSVVHHVTWESEDGVAGTWAVRGVLADGAATPALARPVDDSSAGTSILVVGGDHGLRLTSDAGDEVAVAYLLLSPEAIVD